MNEPEKAPAPPDDAQTERERRRDNIVLLAFFAVVVGVGIWLANAMIDQRRIDDCVAQGGRNCTRIDVPAR